MSTQTEHLGLHQWEAGDSFLRSDFNEDFAKIDAGVKAADAGVAEAKGMATAAEAKLDEFIAAGSGVTGSYAMGQTAAVTVHLGFRPKLLVLIAVNKSYCSLGAFFGTAGFGIQYDSDRLLIRSVAFSVTFNDDGFTIPPSNYFNETKGVECSYFALR